jgi:hypothetical protein
MMAKGDLAGDYSINCATATLKRTKKEFFLLFVSLGSKVVNALENPKNLGAQDHPRWSDYMQHQAR